ncbi:MAG TPA: Hsp20/alpha crystallin family protein [Vicinamibacterales bacterium]|nr:Hsp20/alpha crystallin family protein [Vicinamibacterales bacterium]
MTPKRTALVPRDPFALLTQMTSDLDRMFESSGWPSFRLPLLPARSGADAATWFPEIDVFEKDNRLVTKIDLPGMKKEDVKVEVTDGHLAISGERKTEAEEKKENFYRCEREYGSFYRAVPLPQGVRLEDVKATFADGVLEVSIPLPVKAEAKPRQVEIQEPQRAAKTAA